MKVSGSDWISTLPPELSRQQLLLRKMLALCEADSTVRWLVIGCSLARRSADHLSDLDLAIGITEQDFAVTLPRLRRAVDGLGDLVESYHHRLPYVPETHERIFAQFADRCQIDLMAFPASAPGGSVPDVVVLYDPDDQLVIRDERQPVTPEQIRSWAFRGWCALADLGKYLRRGSAWEALDRLNEARTQLCQLWAVTLHVPDPAYGLTSILDSPPDQLPAAFQDTVSDLDPGRLLHAAQCMAGLLNRVGEQLADNQRAVLPEAMARFITMDLQQMTSSVSTSGRTVPADRWCRSQDCIGCIRSVQAAGVAVLVCCTGRLGSGPRDHLMCTSFGVCCLSWPFGEDTIWRDVKTADSA